MVFAVNNNVTPERITRRTALGLAAGLIVPLVGQAETFSGRKVSDPDLFVFKAPSPDRLVIAVAFSGDGQRTKVRVHADKRSWTLGNANSIQTDTYVKRGIDRVFVGEVLSQSPRKGELRNVVVIEMPFHSLREPGSVEVWAEILSENGSRLRVGNPLLAKALALDPALARIYQSTWPKLDRLLLRNDLANRLAAIAASDDTVANPNAHGQRLAALLLPDVIKYRPELPVGFTFASQNGRHPSDNTAPVVATILRCAHSICSAPNSFQALETFPYFRQPEFG
jgi:hypothetical protein